MQQIVSFYDIIAFGKYKGQTIAWIIERDPDYIMWLDEEAIVKFPRQILDDAYESAMEQSPPEEFFFPDLGDR